MVPLSLSLKLQNQTWSVTGYTNFLLFFCKSIWITLVNWYSWILTPTFRSRSPTIFKAEILADGVKGVLVEDFKGIPTIDLMTLGKFFI